MDPIGEHLDEIQRRGRSGSNYQKKCEEIDGAPTAKQFMTYVRANRPVLFRGAVSHWPAADLWTLAVRHSTTISILTHC